MEIKGAVALVTGSNRGIGREIVKALRDAGVAKIYASARDTAGVADLRAGNTERIIPLELDIRRHEHVARAASECGDVTLLVNNAGINLYAGLIAAPTLDRAREEMETNYFAPLAMCRAFAPILGRNGGGAIVNILSVVSHVNLPATGSASASKAAALSLTLGVRAELAKQGTLVMGVLPAAVDTDMARGFQGPKTPPSDVAQAILKALSEGTEEIYPGDWATSIRAGLASNPKAVEKEFATFLP